MKQKTAKQKTAISPTRAENYAEWYQQVIKAADLAEVSSVRGCMVFNPLGYGIWENIQKNLDRLFKETGHENFYCPLLIPLSFLEKEAEHIQGFAQECAVVTHHRLVTNEEGKLVPASPLEEPFVIRPTSEAIIGEMFARWIHSYRDLPLLRNQWANIVRWEMRTRMFLRTTEFLWQEGHTAHATAPEAREESLKILSLYANFAQDFLALPVIAGEKSASERFPGAVSTYCIEAMMQDGKALQAGTSHFLGQNFARAFNIKFTTQTGEIEHVWTTSWGASTRLIGGLIMTHSDDDGLILPPRIAPLHVVIIPASHHQGNQNELLDYCQEIATELKKMQYHHEAIRVKIDLQDAQTGQITWGWVKKGIPIRLEIGPRELAARTVFMGRRDLPYKDRKTIPLNEFLNQVTEQLDDMQAVLLKRAFEFREKNSVLINSKEDLYQYFKKGGEKSGFAYAYYQEDEKIEAQIKSDLNVTVRCFPHHTSLVESLTGICIFSGSDQGRLAIFAKAY